MSHRYVPLTSTSWLPERPFPEISPLAEKKSSYLGPQWTQRAKLGCQLSPIGFFEFTKKCQSHSEFAALTCVVTTCVFSVHGDSAKGSQANRAAESTILFSCLLPPQNGLKTCHSGDFRTIFSGFLLLFVNVSLVQIPNETLNMRQTNKTSRPS